MTSTPWARRLFCNRTLNFRSIRAIGYDMDYTLVHYDVEQWERRAYEYLRDQLASEGWPVQHLKFEPQRVCRGLIIDTQHGNLIKANRFGFVRRAMHGTEELDFSKQRELYSRTIIDLADRRWIFLNTLFSLSEGCIFAQLVELLDQRKIPEVLGYAALYERVKTRLDATHMEGRLKAEIIAAPEKYVMLDPETALALLDQHYAGKKLMLITNSEWHYTQSMMSYAFDRFLPKGMTWRGLFNVVIISARKPHFFTTPSPFFEIVTEDGLLKPTTGNLRAGSSYLGGSAHEVERHLGLSGDEILYVGDHMFGDVHVSKSVLRWRTALILRELEEELAAIDMFRESETRLTALMTEKEALENELSDNRLTLQRIEKNYGQPQKNSDHSKLKIRSETIRQTLVRLDAEIARLAEEAGRIYNPHWGLLMRAGNDKSHLAYQVERYADIYTSRVSNLALATPFVYLRSPRGSLPHDPPHSPSHFLA